MIKFTKNKEGKFDIIGPVDEMPGVGETATVTKANGETQDVIVTWVSSKPFQDQFNDQGMLVFAKFNDGSGGGADCAALEARICELEKKVATLEQSSQQSQPLPPVDDIPF